MSQSAKWYAAVIVAGLAMTPVSAADAGLDGEWRLVGVQGQAVDSGATLLVKEGHVSGSTGCNRFRASYEATGTAIKIAPVSATKMYCQNRADVERAYLAALETVTAFTMSGDKLIMDYQPGDHMLEFAR